MEYVNLNKCRSYKITLAGLTKLVDQHCSEVIIVNKTGSDILVYDNGFDDAGNAFALGDDETFTFRGITNSDMVSASGTGDIYIRTQFYSNTPSR